uniref:Uncharacterized protein n=1 Tax=Trichobilharzia regenti TaxID=157069 RepID=A0AA85JCG2_TRIRE|nr:unnamed protein product [Trichobilharzia regenti]
MRSYGMSTNERRCSVIILTIRLHITSQISPLKERLSDFISEENNKDFKDHYLNLLSNLKANISNFGKFCADFDSPKNNVSNFSCILLHRKDTISSSKLAKLNEQEIFSDAFRRMIHSPVAQDFIQLEKSFAIAVGYELDKRNDVLNEMDQKHIDETERSLQKRGSEVSETITQLQEDFYLSREIVESHWDSCISALKWEQRQALRKFVMSFEEHVRGLPENNNRASISQTLLKDSSSKRPNSLSNKSSSNNHTIFKQTEHIPLSETFTVQLGRQLRTVFNFRLTRLDPSEILADTKFKTQENHLSDDNNLAERMNNALNIYSNNLNGLVILVDKRINSFRGIKKFLVEACERSTELHFPELGSQLESIQDTINRLGSRQSTDPHCMSKVTNASNGTPTTAKSKYEHFEPIHGDVLITKHSNLISGTGGGINVIFQMVLDEDCENNIRIPSPLHCAISAILRTCFDYDITTLSLPLLLVPSLSENMDRTWRAKRVETVLKAVKGALMELITWRGLNLRSIQFLAPSNTTDDELNVFRQIISNSFLQPNPLIAI